MLERNKNNELDGNGNGFIPVLVNLFLSFNDFRYSNLLPYPDLIYRKHYFSHITNTFNSKMITIEYLKVSHWSAQSNSIIMNAKWLFLYNIAGFLDFKFCYFQTYLNNRAIQMLTIADLRSFSIISAWMLMPVKCFLSSLQVLDRISALASAYLHADVRIQKWDDWFFLINLELAMPSRSSKLLEIGCLLFVKAFRDRLAPN